MSDAHNTFSRWMPPVHVIQLNCLRMDQMEYVRKGEVASIVSLTSCTDTHAAVLNKNYTTKHIICLSTNCDFCACTFSTAVILYTFTLHCSTTFGCLSVLWTAKVLQHPVWTFLPDPTDGTDEDDCLILTMSSTCNKSLSHIATYIIYMFRAF